VAATLQDTFDPKQLPHMRHITPKDKFLEYFELIDIFRKALMGMCFGPKATPPPPKEDLGQYLHSGAEDSKFRLTFS